MEETKMTGIFIFPKQDEKINYFDYIGTIQSEIVKYFGTKHCKTDNEHYPMVVVNNINVIQEDLNNIRKAVEKYDFSANFLTIIGTEDQFNEKINEEILVL